MDRNDTMQIVVVIVQTSLSARRAWIEIVRGGWLFCVRLVALRKESVDRNSPGMNTISYITASLSARRAWIEISCLADMSAAWNRRSPQGERG